MGAKLNLRVGQQEIIIQNQYPAGEKQLLSCQPLVLAAQSDFMG